MIVNWATNTHMTDREQTLHYRRYSGNIFCQSLKDLDSDYSSQRCMFSTIIRKWQIDLTRTAKLLSLIEASKSWLHYGVLISLEISIIYKNSVNFCRELSKGGWIGGFKVFMSRIPPQNYRNVTFKHLMLYLFNSDNWCSNARYRMISIICNTYITVFFVRQ